MAIAFVRKMIKLEVGEKGKRMQVFFDSETLKYVNKVKLQ